MPDELTNQDDFQTTSEQGQSDGTTDQAQATDSTTQERTAPKATSEEPMVRQRDLRALKATLDRQISDRDAMINDMRQRLRDSETRGMDDAELYVYNLKERELELQQREQNIVNQQSEIQRVRLFAQVNQETGIPIPFLEEHAQDYEHAWKLGTQYLRLLSQQQAGASQQTQADARRQQQNGRVDVGSGRPRTNNPRAAYEEALKSGDGQAAARAYREALAAERQGR